MRIKKVLIVMVIGIAVVVLVTLLPSDKKTKYEEIWNISLPKDAVSRYYQHSDTGFHGDGEYYEIFETQNINQDNQTWISKKNKNIENLFENNLKDLNIPAQKYPDFTTQYMYQMKESEQGDDYLIMLYQNNHLYMLMNLL